MSGLAFGFVFYFDNASPHRAKLSYTHFDGAVIKQSVNKGSDINKLKVKFRSKNTTFAQPNGLQLLGTQADYDENGLDVPVFGIYYRERQCTPGMVKQTYNVCIGKTIVDKVFGSSTI